MQTVPEFRHERCVRYRYRYSECSRCQEACPHEAVTLSEDGAAIDPANCRNCALCVAACPTEAWHAENLPHVELLKQASGNSSFAIACAPSQAEGDARVPCLGALDASFLAYLASHGIAVELKGGWHCTACPHGLKGAAMLEFTQEGLMRLHAGIGNEKWASILLAEPEEAEKNTTHQLSNSRRQLFRRFVGKAVTEASRLDMPARSAVPLKAVRAAAPLSTVRRELVQAIWPAVGEGEFSCDAAVPFADIKLSPGCTACEVCARVCPTGALTVRESQVRWELVFQFGRCVACGVCLESCQPGVLAFAANVPLAAGRSKEAVPLHALDKRRCTRCDRFFITSGTEELCPVCGGDEQDFASIFG